MPSYLGKYDGCASDRERKFFRAVDSFQNQTYENKELVIVSDGCATTNKLFDLHYLKEDFNIKLVYTTKKKIFSGKLRHLGIKEASGEIICYLDTDDFFDKNHLKTIADAFENDNTLDWVYYNDYIYKGDSEKPLTKIVELEHGSIGTSSIAHKNNKTWFWGLPKVSWKGCDGYGHDWTFIQRLVAKYPNYKKIVGCGYYICHLPNIWDK